MMWLLVLADVALIATVSGYVLQNNSLFFLNNQLLFKLLCGLGTGMLDSALNVFHWLFACEYWQASHKIPSGKQRTNENFTIVKWIGLAINVVGCGVLTYYEWILQHGLYIQYETGTQVPQSIVRGVVIWENVVSILALASAVLLARALWRIHGFFRSHNELMLNSRLMAVHVSMLVLVVVIDLFWATGLQIIYSKSMWTLLAVANAGYFTLQLLLQLIALFVFVKLTNNPDRSQVERRDKLQNHNKMLYSNHDEDFVVTDEEVFSQMYASKQSTDLF
jgi:magnesium-transporting ATPase (P-type)